MTKFHKLSNTEMEVMKIIWNLNKEVTSSELLKTFATEKGKKWSNQTMSTFLSRMVEKGTLTSSKKGRGNVYKALVTQREYEQSEAQGILNSIYKGSIKNFLAALYYEKGMGIKEIEDLKEWFSEK